MSDLDALDQWAFEVDNQPVLALIQRLREAEANERANWIAAHDAEQNRDELRERLRATSDAYNIQANRIAQLERVREAAQELVDEYDIGTIQGLLSPAADLRAALAAVEEPVKL